MGGARVRRVLLPVLVAAAASISTAQASAFEFLQQYGVGYSTAGPGGFPGSIYGIAVAPDGTVVASDNSTYRISMFSPSGKFLRAFGKDVSLATGEGPEVCVTDCKYGQTGGEGGALNSPYGVAAGPSEIYVAENSAARVSAFDYQGHFLRTFGKNVGGPGVNVCSSACNYGEFSTAAGGLGSPAGLALDAGGDLLVSELSNNRVSAFNPQTGQFLRAFGKNVGGPGVNVCTATCMSGESSSNPGALSGPYGLAVGPEGNSFVAESGNSRVSVFDASGQFMRSFGAVGNGAGNLSSPYGVAVAPDGTAYVADTFNYRLSVFGADGTFRRALGWNVNGFNTGAGTCTGPCQMGSSEYGIGGFNNIYAVAIDCRGTAYVANYYRIDKYGEPGVRTAPCPSNAISFGKSTANKKKGTLTVEVTVPGPGALIAGAGAKIAVNAPQPSAAGIVIATLKATGKGVRSLARTGKLKGTLSVTFTPPNGDPNTQSEAVQLAKRVKKHKKRGKHKGGKKGGKRHR